MSKIYEFRWKAVNRFGQKQQGKQLAESRANLEQQLLAKGYQIRQIQRNFVLASEPKPSEITQTLAQFAILLNASIPLKQALAMTLQNCSQIKLYQWLTTLNQLLASGYAFSDCLTKANRFITPQEIQLVKIGEQSGKLGIMLSKIAEARQQSEKLAQKVKKILFYPVIVLAISLALSLGLLIFIVPQFVDLYGNKNHALPLLTHILFRLSDFLLNHGSLLLGFAFLAVIFFSLFAKKLPFLTACKGALPRHLPIFRQIIAHSRLIFFSQNLALMLNAHIRMDTALNAFLSEQTFDPILQREVKFLLTQLKQGYKFADSLNPAVFGTEAIQMIAIGEQSGKLAQMCEHISEIYQQKLDYQIDLLSQLLEPMLMLIMGAIVGTILIGLYLPIFDMGSLME